jgi:F0F1-type ATP synthase assembly protein I
MGVAIAIGLLIGMWLDRLLGTRPWLTIVFLGFGIAAGFKNLVTLARREAARKDDGEGNERT